MIKVQRKSTRYFTIRKRRIRRHKEEDTETQRGGYGDTKREIK